MSYFAKHEEWGKAVRLPDWGNATLEMFQGFVPRRKFELIDLKPDTDI